MMNVCGRPFLQKDSTKNTEDALLDVYKKLRPGEPPTVESSLTHLNNLFFDAKRYDLCRFGRYKYNKKLGIASRLAGHTLSRPVINEMTGELLFDAGTTLTYEQAEQIQEAGVKAAFLTVECKEYYVTEAGENAIRFVQREVKVIGNGMVDLQPYVQFDISKYEINEKDFVLCSERNSRKLFHTGRSRRTGKEGGWMNSFRSILFGRYLCNHQLFPEPLRRRWYSGRHRPLGQPSNPFCWRTVAEPVPDWFHQNGTGHSGTDEHSGTGYGRDHTAEFGQYPSNYGCN